MDFKWDDEADACLLAAFFESTNSTPENYDPLAEPLGPDVSSWMVQYVLPLCLPQVVPS